MSERIRWRRIVALAGFVSLVWGTYALGVDLDWLADWPAVATVLTLHCVVTTFAAVGVAFHEVVQ